MAKDSFNTFRQLTVADKSYGYFSLPELAGNLGTDIRRLPYSIRILLENLMRNEDGTIVTDEDVKEMANWNGGIQDRREVPLMPARVLLQDFTGVPSVVDLAAMREAADRLYGDPMKINPLIPAELVIDHSVQVDHFGSQEAFALNDQKDYERNGERYAFLRWGQQSFSNFKVVPPATGICHQVNLEYLGRVVFPKPEGDGWLAYPDSLVGLDSHTTMINGIGVMGWGVGGIEAEAVMLGRPYYLLTPEVIGFQLTGKLPSGTTATDLVLTVTQMLREKGVVGKFVEFFGPGLSAMTVEDRATISNMSPEYGATMGFFPVDERTIEYLRLTGRDDDQVALVESYCKAQGLFRTDDLPEPVFTDSLSLDMGTVAPCLAGPKRPQDRILLDSAKESFLETARASCKIHGENGSHRDGNWEGEGGKTAPHGLPSGICCDPDQQTGFPVEIDGESTTIGNGAIVIAAITSCTNTSNPSVLIGAGLLAKKAVEKGLTVKPWVKTSLAPGSKVAIDYLQSAGLMPYLEQLRFHHVAYGCTTCIGNSGPLAAPIAKAVTDNDLIVASVLSGNRNFEGRINPLTRANYLASPILVVAYALCGKIHIDFKTQPIGTGTDGAPVFLKDLWPDPAEIDALIQKHVSADMYRADYATVFDGDQQWQALPVPEGGRYEWSDASTYIKEPPFFDGIGPDVPELTDIRDARVLALLGDTVTTDHISPAGAIPEDGPAGEYLKSLGVGAAQFNSFGSRRGNHEVMMRGTFGNIRLSNLLVPGVNGGVTRLMPEGTQTSIYEAAMTYQNRNTPLVVIAGKEYGTGSSRDWAAKGTALLGVKAVIARSFERIHRSNLVCMGVLPMEFLDGDSAESIGLDGTETFTINGIGALAPGKTVTVSATRADGTPVTFQAMTRIDSPVELTYFQHGGILNFVLREMGKQ